MRKCFLFIGLLLSLSVCAAEYVGTMRMANGYTQEQVHVCLDEQGKQTLYHVKFARMIPRGWTHVHYLFHHNR